MRILISGATGLVGTALDEALRAEGNDVRRLVRAKGTARAGDVEWHPASGRVDTGAMEGADAVVCLGGESVAGGRWTEERKKLLRTSRVDATRVLVEAVGRMKQKPKVFVAASAIGIYGHRGEEDLTETSGPGNDFLAVLARDWEAAATQAESSGIRAVCLRFGVILSTRGGALPRMLTPFKLGAGGRLGSGKQWMSWIALEDAVGIVRAAIADERIRGPVNVVAPNPVRNDEFTRVLARVLHRPAVFPAPAFMLRLMLGEMADALLLSSQRVRPVRMMEAGYQFKTADLESALRSIIRGGS